MYLKKYMESATLVNMEDWQKTQHRSISDIAVFAGHVFSHMARAWDNKKSLSEITQKVVERDPLSSSYYERKILDSLLGSCASLLRADSGSVMTVNRSGCLHISAALRLDADIVKKTNIKIGDGIAGVAASLSEPIILPKDRNKNGLSKKMNRQQIRSSMIVPFKKANSRDVYGVLNLNVSREDKEFTYDDVALAEELVTLASIALVSV
jgi:signal transduction protein with GAF and PtsI domain